MAIVNPKIIKNKNGVTKIDIITFVLNFRCNKFVIEKQIKNTLRSSNQRLLVLNKITKNMNANNTVYNLLSF